MGVGGQHHAPAPIVQEAGWASETTWIGAENLVPAGIRSPDLPARNESLYRLRHPSSLSDFIETLTLSTNFRTSLKYQISSNPSRGSQIVQCGRTDGHDEADSRFTAILRTRLKIGSNHLFVL